MQENNAMVCWDNDLRFCNFIERIEDEESIEEIVSDEEMPALEEHESSEDKETLAYVKENEENEFGPTFLFEGLEMIDPCSVYNIREEKVCNVIISGEEESRKYEKKMKKCLR